MPRAKPRKPIAPDDDPDDETTAPGNNNDRNSIDADETLQDFFGRFPEGNRATVSVYDEDTGRWQFRASVEPEIVSEEYIQKRFGQGTYRVQLRNARGHLAQRSMLQIGAPVDDRTATPAAAAPAPIVDPYQILQAQNQRQHEMILAMINRERPAAAGMDLAQIIPLMKMLTDSKQTSLADQLETLKSLRELTGDGGGDGGVDFMKTLREMLMPLLAEKLAGRFAAKTPATRALANPPDEDDPGIDAVIENAIAMFKPAAQGGADPIVMARLALQYGQRDETGNTIDFLGQLADERFPIALAQLGAYDAELTREPLAGWLEIFHGALKDEIQRLANPGGNTGNARDVARDGAPGDGRTARPDNAGNGDRPYRAATRT